MEGRLMLDNVMWGIIFGIFFIYFTKQSYYHSDQAFKCKDDYIRFQRHARQALQCRLIAIGQLLILAVYYVIKGI